MVGKALKEAPWDSILGEEWEKTISTLLLSREGQTISSLMWEHESDPCAPPFTIPCPAQALLTWDSASPVLSLPVL